MQTRVIKFNLVGAIFVLLLIITIIVGIIVGLSKNKDDNKKETNKNEQTTEEQIIEKNQYTETININGEEQTMDMLKCEGSYNYTMFYDKNSFYVQKDVKGKDKYKSLYSNTVYIDISKVDEKMDESEIYELAKQNEKEATEVQLNGQKAIKVDEKNTDETIYNYYVKNDKDNYYIIEIKCSKQFEVLLLPIIEKMIETFTII